MSKFNMDTIKGFAASALAFSKKNAPSIMTGGSIILGWTAAYIFWKQSKKAEAKIKAEEEKLNENTKEHENLSVKDKGIIYLQYCWLALVLGLGSTGLSIAANKINLDRLAEMYVLTQFLSNKDEKNKNLIDKLKGELDKKTVTKIENEVRDSRFSEEEIKSELKQMKDAGETTTLFIDMVTGKKFRAKMFDVREGVYKFNEDLKKYRTDLVMEKINGPYYVSSSPFKEKIDDILESDEFNCVYSSSSLSDFLEYIGEKTDRESSKLADNVEFRYYGGSIDPVEWSSVFNFKKFEDPETGVPAVCYIDYDDCLAPSHELMDRE